MAALDITRSIDIKAPVAKVWAAPTEPDLIGQWFGDTVEFDASPGGGGAFGWKGPRHVPGSGRARRQTQCPGLPVDPRFRRRPGAGETPQW